MGRNLLSSITLLIIQTRSLVGLLQPEAPTAPLPCSDKVHPCCFPQGPLEQDGCTPSLCHSWAEKTPPALLLQGRDHPGNKPRGAQPSHASLGAQCKRSSSPCTSLHLPPPLGLSLRRGKGRWHLGSVPQGSTEGAFAVCHTPHSSSPSHQHIHLCPAAPGSSLPHHPTAQSPCPARGQPSCSSRVCPGPLPRSGHAPGQLEHCNSGAQEAQAVLSPPGHPGGAASCPTPDRLGPSVGATCPGSVTPSWGRLFHEASL